MSHTPGPWEPMINNDGTIRGITGLHGPERVNVINWNGISRASSEIGQANANLMIAAPKLLGALKMAYSRLASMQYPERHTPECQMELCIMRDVIAAATGKPAEEVQNEAEGK